MELCFRAICLLYREIEDQPGLAVSQNIAHLPPEEWEWQQMVRLKVIVQEYMPVTDKIQYSINIMHLGGDLRVIKIWQGKLFHAPSYTANTWF